MIQVRNMEEGLTRSESSGSLPPLSFLRTRVGLPTSAVRLHSPPSEASMVAHLTRFRPSFNSHLLADIISKPCKDQFNFALRPISCRLSSSHEIWNMKISDKNPLVAN